MLRTQWREAGCGFRHLPFHLLGAENFWCGQGRKEKERADVSLYNWVQLWPSGLAMCQSISFSMVLVRTVVAPTYQLERDSCPSSNLVHWRSFERSDRKFQLNPSCWLSYYVPLIQMPLCPLCGGSRGCSPQLHLHRWGDCLCLFLIQVTQPKQW